jgi:SAM-dependent methyltransferase
MPSDAPLPLTPEQEETRQSWNVATAAHNVHKVDQGRWLRQNSSLFPEEVGLLGDISGKELLHLCCNSGQDTISLQLRQGARCCGVDMSEVAIAAARQIAAEAEADLPFVHDEVLHFLEHTERRVDVVFGSYGFLPWMHDLPQVARGIRRVLRPGGRLVVVEFHPMAWSFDAEFRLVEPYFAPGVFFSDPVSDYVGAAEGALSPSGHKEVSEVYVNPHRSHAVQHSLADIVNALVGAGLPIQRMEEWPWSNGCRLNPALVARGSEGLDARRFQPPPGVPSIPLMMGVVAGG